jgi:hypothetical protein
MRFLAAALLIFGIGLTTAPALAIPANQSYATEQVAQQHCPTDVVVWVNTKSGVYHFKGQRWYGTTKSGTYACQKEADASGDRPTRNGQ